MYILLCCTNVIAYACYVPCLVSASAFVCIYVSMFDCFLPPSRKLCFHRCLPVCLLATLRKNFQTDLHEIFRDGWQWASEQLVKFWLRSGSGIRIQIRIATLVTRALAEVCTVPVLLVFLVLSSFEMIHVMRRNRQTFCGEWERVRVTSRV